MDDAYPGAPTRPGVRVTSYAMYEMCVICAMYWMYGTFQATRVNSTVTSGGPPATPRYTPLCGVTSS